MSRRPSGDSSHCTGPLSSVQPRAKGREAVESHHPDPAVAGWVPSLSTERLVGGEPVRSDEPPVIVALAALSSRELYRLSHATGQAKAVLAGILRSVSGGAIQLPLFPIKK